MALDTNFWITPTDPVFLMGSIKIIDSLDPNINKEDIPDALNGILGSYREAYEIDAIVESYLDSIATRIVSTGSGNFNQNSKNIELLQGGVVETLKGLNVVLRKMNKEDKKKFIISHKKQRRWSWFLSL